MEQNFTSRVKVYYTTFENPFLQEKTIFKNATQKLCYMYLQSYANARKIFPSMESIAVAICSTKRTAINIIDQLNELGLIEITKRDGKSNIYILNDYYDIEAKILSGEKISPVKKLHGGSEKISPLPVKNFHPKTKTKKQKENKIVVVEDNNKIDIDLKGKYPNAPFDVIKQNLLNDDNLTINTINQYKGLLEYRLKNYKEPTKPKKGTSKKPVRKEMVPTWLNEEEEVKKEEQEILNREQFELEKKKLFDRIKKYKEQKN